MVVSLDILPHVKGTYLFNAPLNKYSWLGVGGNAECMFIPQDIEDLVNFLKKKPKNIPIFVLGAGSNTLIRDGGIDGITIKFSKNFEKIERIMNQPIISAGAGASDVSVANFALKNMISGFEFLYGIPGSIGGATIINAGAYGSEISQILQSVDIIRHSGEAITVSKEELGYSYRKSRAEQDWIVVRAVLKGNFGDPMSIKNLMKEIQIKRSHSQPINMKTCGSTFKNPKHHKAWHLIEDSGCCGLKVGGAIISHLHCNFIVNDGSATATDIEELIKSVKARVYKHTSIMLEEEVVIVGKY